jgi:hypothetical protein
MRFPPTVNLVCSGSAFCGRTSQTNLPHVTVLCFRTCACLMKNIVSAPFVRSPTPCANLPNSFSPDAFQIGLNFRSEFSWWYVSALTVMGWMTDIAIGMEFEGSWQYGAVVLLMMDYACWRELAAVLLGYWCGNCVG